MPNQTNGLRFDVYERVHLPEDVAAIDELEEIELVPRIQIVQQGEQVLLKGHLLLTGVYRAENELDANQALEHWIPVEITLPMNRIHRLDDISVEIDNFDVDLLSARTLNITGVLSLLGIELDQPRDQEVWPREEPFTVVHKREEEQNQWGAGADSYSIPNVSDQPETAANSSYAPESWLAAAQPSFGESLIREAAQREAAEREREAAEQEERIREAQQWELEAQIAEAQRVAEEQEAQQSDAIARAAFAREEQLIAEARQEALNREKDLIEEERLIREQELAAEAAYSNRNAEQLLHQQDLEAQAEITRNADEAEAADETPPQALQSAGSGQSFGGEPLSIDSEAERKELKVALGSKRVEEEKEPSPGGIGFRSLLQSSRREQEARAAAEQIAERAAAEARKSTDDDIEWKNLFYGRSGEDHSFRKVRLCIVQREETLEAIAGRYQLQPREIVLYNRLADQNVSEGQVLYIP
ncbi:LysM peptidoglycan-binding domain-containing protein [Paenibacillus solisilvae]|uniref:LysM peptidoglycan-binding domain-containing protein n=1 Tax=Paenibacillus solisilvae TaxID=2486751 RepID=A0ABW0W1P0_9BACL